MRVAVSALRRGVALFAYIAVVLVVPVTYADDAAAPLDPPQARIHPPGGLTVHSRIKPPSGDPVDSRIQPPSGEPTADARIKPPGGVIREEPTVLDLFIEWLRAQARIKPPTG